jgi:predicted restriction endonuclease
MYRIRLDDKKPTTSSVESVQLYEQAGTKLDEGHLHYNHFLVTQNDFFSKSIKCPITL